MDVCENKDGSWTCSLFAEQCSVCFVVFMVQTGIQCAMLGGSEGIDGGEDGDREVLEMGLPLGRQLEELDVVPLHAIHHHCNRTGSPNH